PRAVSRPISAMTFDGEEIPRRLVMPPTRPSSQPLILSHSQPAMLEIPFQRPLTIFLPVSSSHLPASLTRFHILPGRSVNHLKMVLAAFARPFAISPTLPINQLIALIIAS